MLAIPPSLPPSARDPDPDAALANVTREPRLLDRVRDAIRVRHYSIRTEQSYTGWIRRFILFHGKRHPAGMGKVEVEAFLTPQDASETPPPPPCPCRPGAACHEKE